MFEHIFRNLLTNAGNMLLISAKCTAYTSAVPLSWFQAKLIHIVCIVVLTSGPDEPLLGRCAMVMADWSISSEFAREMVLTLETGRSLSILMRSVTPATRVGALVEIQNKNWFVAWKI